MQFYFLFSDDFAFLLPTRKIVQVLICLSYFYATTDEVKIYLISTIYNYCIPTLV